MFLIARLAIALYIVLASWAASVPLTPPGTCGARYGDLGRAAREPESILVIGAGRSGATSPFLVDGINKFSGHFPGSSFFTASRRSQAPWPGSKAHFDGIDRNEEKSLSRMLAAEKPSVIIDAAGAHMADALRVHTIEEAREEGRRQARVMVDYLRWNPRANLIFLSSQYADVGMKDALGVGRTFEVVGISQPVSVRLYAEMKAGYEEELLKFGRESGQSNFQILRLGTLLSEGYRAKSAQGLVESGAPNGKSFTPDTVLRDSIAALLQAIHQGKSTPSLLEISSKDGFQGPKALGVETEPLEAYVDRLRKAWEREK